MFILRKKKEKKFLTDTVFNSIISDALGNKIAYDFFRNKTSVKRGHKIYSQGDPSKDIYILFSGQILITREESLTKKRFKCSLVQGERAKMCFKISILN